MIKCLYIYIYIYSSKCDFS